MHGRHKDGKSIADVIAVNAFSKTINFIPDFTPAAKNIIALSATRTRILRLRQRDLKPYIKLVYLNIAFNALKHLDKDVFIHNLQLKYININSNRITKIHPKIFDNLKSLEMLSLNQNSCLKKAEKNQLSLQQWIKIINEECQNFPEQIIARPREEYKKNVKERTNIWVTFGVTFATFSISVIVIVFLYMIKKALWN